MPLVAVIFMKAVLFGDVLNVELERYTPSLAYGMVFWRFISGQILTNSMAIVGSQGIIKQRNFPLFSFILRNLTRAVFEFLYSFAAVTVVVLFYYIPTDVSVLLALPAVIIVEITLLCSGFVLAMLCCRMPDLHGSLISAMRVLFLLTPIIWLPEMVSGQKEFLLNLNPFYHLLETVRDPLIGQPIEWLNWQVSIGLMLISILLMNVVYHFLGRKSVFWI